MCLKYYNLRLVNKENLVKEYLICLNSIRKKSLKHVRMVFWILRNPGFFFVSPVSASHYQIYHHTDAFLKNQN